MNDEITFDELEDAISEVLDNYCTDLRDAINTDTATVAEELRKSISADAPVGDKDYKKRKHGTQKKSWKVAKEKVAGIDLVCIVHSTDYQLVHLLENGHLTRDGKTRSKAFHYVSRNEEEMQKKYLAMLEKTIRTVK